MKEAVDEYLLEVGPEKVIGQPLAVDLHAPEGAQGGDLLAMDVLHGEEPAGHVTRHRARDKESGKIPEVLADRSEAARLVFVVELAEEALPELGNDPARPQAVARFRVAVEEIGDLVHAVEVLQDLLADSRPLHLHRHGPAIAERGAMHLSQ